MLREAIRNEMRDRAKHRKPELNCRSLAVAAGLVPSTVHRYLKGESDLASRRCDRLLQTLDLVLTRRGSTTMDTCVRSCVIRYSGLRGWGYRELAGKGQVTPASMHRFLADRAPTEAVDEGETEMKMKMDLCSVTCDRLLLALDVLVVSSAAFAWFVAHRPAYNRFKVRGWYRSRAEK